MGPARSVPLSDVSHLVKLTIITGYWSVSQEFLFLSNTFWFCQPSPMLYSKLFLSLLLLFHILLLILFHYQAQWYYYPQLLWPPPTPHWFSQKCYKRITGKVSNNKVSHLVWDWIWMFSCRAISSYEMFTANKCVSCHIILVPSYPAGSLSPYSAFIRLCKSLRKLIRLRWLDPTYWKK